MDESFLQGTSEVREADHRSFSGVGVHAAGSSGAAETKRTVTGIGENRSTRVRTGNGQSR